MTAPRIVRGTKARIFLYICGCVIIIGLIACYNNTLSQLESARKSSEICHQQEENLSTQLQVITEYKQRLERSLKTEKAEHQQSKNELEKKMIELKSQSEKSDNELNLRFSSLQQHYNLLKTEHDDFKEVCTKKQDEQLNEINTLQAKLREVQEELRKVENAKAILQAQYSQLQNDNENLEEKVKNLVNPPNHGSKLSELPNLNQNLHNELYQNKQDTSFIPKFHILEVSSKEPPSSSNKSVNVNDIQSNRVLAPPKDSGSSTTKSTTLASNRVSQGILNNARPLILPTVTPKSANKFKEVLPDFIPLPYKNNLPEGVVAPPDTPDSKKTEDEKNELPADDPMGMRYRNKIDNQNNVKNDEENENKAHEEIDGQGHNYDAFGFDNDPIKNAEKQNFEKQHINNLVVGRGAADRENKNLYDYKDNRNDIQLEENEDDDPDEYDDHLGGQKDPAVRN